MVRFIEEKKRPGSSLKVINVEKHGRPYGQISRYPGDCGWLCSKLGGEFKRIPSLTDAKKWFSV